MKPKFALDLSHEGINLLHRSKGGWTLVGSVALDDADMRRRLADLRRRAADLESGGFTSKIIIPNSQILYTTLEAPGPDDIAREVQIRSGLDGLTPYRVGELVFDWRAAGEKARVAVLARDTMDEAETFAVEHKFNPVSFVARPPSGEFSGEPFFGKTRAATRILGPTERVEPDASPVPRHAPLEKRRVSGAVSAAIAAVAAEELAARQAGAQFGSQAGSQVGSEAGSQAGPQTAPQPAPRPAPRPGDVAPPAPSAPPDDPFAELDQIQAELSGKAVPQPHPAPAPPGPAPRGPAPRNRARAPRSQDSGQPAAPPLAPFPPTPDEAPPHPGEPQAQKPRGKGNSPPTAPGSTVAGQPQAQPAPGGATRTRMPEGATQTRMPEGDAGARAAQAAGGSVEPPDDDIPDPPGVAFRTGSGGKGRVTTAVPTAPRGDSAHKAGATPAQGSRPQTPASAKSSGAKAAQPDPRHMAPGDRQRAEMAAALRSPLPGADGKAEATDGSQGGAAEETPVRSRLSGAMRGLRAFGHRRGNRSSPAASGGTSPAASGVTPPAASGVTPPAASGVTPPAVSGVTPPPMSGTAATPAPAPVKAETATGPSTKHPASDAGDTGRGISPEETATSGSATAVSPGPAPDAPEARAGDGAEAMPDPAPGPAVARAPGTDPGTDPATTAPVSAKPKPFPKPNFPPRAKVEVTPAKPDPTLAKPGGFNVFGQRPLPEKTGLRKYSGLILTLLLVLCMVVIGFWSTLFVDDGDEPLFNPGDAPVATPDAPGTDPVAPEPPANDPSTGSGTGQESGPESGAADPEGTPGAADTPVPRVLTQEEAEARYAESQVWQRAPETMAEPHTPGLDVGNVGGPGALRGDPAAAATGDDAAPARPAPPASGRPAPQAPPPADTLFDLDANGLVRPTPQGAVSPSGITVYQGRPPVVPPRRPGSPAPNPISGETPSDPAPADSPLAAAPAQRSGQTPVAASASTLPPALFGPAEPRPLPDDVAQAAALAAAQQAAAQAGTQAVTPATTVPASATATDPIATATDAAVAAAVDAVDVIEASFVNPTPEAVALSPKPHRRPANIDQIVSAATARAAAEAQAAAEAAANAAAAATTPSIPTSASVAERATVPNALNMREINLLGISGPTNARRALVRMPNGRYVTVETGDRLDGGRVTSITDTGLTYQKGSRSYALQLLPRG